MPEIPVGHLSLSSVRALHQCPERWRRRYIEREYERPNGAMTLGKVIGAAEAQSDHTWIESGEPLSTDDVLDAYASGFDLAAEEDDIDWSGESPATAKDSGVGAIRAYHRDVRPHMSTPIDAERESVIDVAHEDGSTVEFVAYLDVETEDGIVIDRKVKSKKLAQADADKDHQPTAYLAARRAEGTPATGFQFHPMVRVKQPYAESVPTTRSDAELDTFLASIIGAAEEIAWRSETDNWSYAPDGAWWCSAKSCGYWHRCPGGGLYRSKRPAPVEMAVRS